VSVFADLRATDGLPNVKPGPEPKPGEAEAWSPKPDARSPIMVVTELGPGSY